MREGLAFVWWHRLLAAILICISYFFGSYLKLKGQNLATKEDIQSITHARTARKRGRACLLKQLDVLGYGFRSLETNKHAPTTTCRRSERALPRPELRQPSGNHFSQKRDKKEDFEAFEQILFESLHIHKVELFSLQLMPNHYHLVPRPLVDGEMSRFMGWIGGTHTMRYHAHYHTSGMEHVYQQH